MSSQRYDVLSPRKYKSGNEEKTFWDKVGVAFEARNGDGFDVTLHCVPCPQDGAIRLMCRVPKDKNERGGGQRRGGQHDAGGYDGGGAEHGGDDIPFSPVPDIG